MVQEVIFTKSVNWNYLSKAISQKFSKGVVVPNINLM